MATSKPAARGGQAKRSASSGPGSKTRASSASRSKRPAAGRTNASRSSAARRSSGGSSRTVTRQEATGNGGVAGSLKQVASKVKGPAVAVGATAVGVAGGLVLRNHQRRNKILGVSVPRLSDVDVKAVAKSVGKASRQLGETSRSVSKDIERVGVQAERIGKLLG